MVEARRARDRTAIVAFTVVLCAFSAVASQCRPAAVVGVEWSHLPGVFLGAFAVSAITILALLIVPVTILTDSLILLVANCTWSLFLYKNGGPPLSYTTVSLAASLVGLGLWFVFVTRRPHQPISKRQRVWFPYLMKTGAAAVLVGFFIPWAAIPMVIAHYAVVSHYRTSPIVYLRRERGDKGIDMFQYTLIREIGATLGASGVVVGLGRGWGTRAMWMLGSRTTAIIFRSVQHREWKAWIEHEVRNAAAIIIDRTGMKKNTGLAWEYGKLQELVAQGHVPRERVLVLSNPNDPAAEQEPSFEELHYERQNALFPTAVKLAEWLESRW